jgi:class 3 adenylate cyclase
MLALAKPRPELHAAAAQLHKHGVPAVIRNRLAAFLDEAQPREVYHVNPRYVAEQLRLDERATLRVLVAALYEGLVTLHWDVRCPACGHCDGHAGLGEVRHEQECSLCHSRFGPRLDNEVRVTFSVHPRFRSLYTDANDIDFRAGVEARLGPVSGQALLLIAEFRRLFPSQRLLPEESVEVARVAILFTDLAGSTALYAQRGDPRAYHLVRLHFDELRAAADEAGGVVIKNIGDAVMAAFDSPAEALAGALAMQQRIAALNQRERLSDDERLSLKVGLHSGPCLGVTFNDRPDYFGTTVNVAARVQALSRGGDVVFTETICAEAGAQSLIQAHSPEMQRVMVKGIEGELKVYRLQS